MLLTLLKNGVEAPMLINMLITRLGIISPTLGNIPRILNYSPKKQRELNDSNSFGKAIELRLKLIELSIISKAEEPNKLEGRAVLEIDVAEGK